MARDRVEFDVVGRDSSGSKAFKQVGDAAARAGDQVDDLGKKSTTAGEQVEDLGDKARQSGRDADEAGEQYQGLAADIIEAQAAMRALANEIDRTGNLDLVRDLDRQRRELRKLTRVKDLLPDDGETKAEAVRFGGRIAEGVASGLSRAGGPITAALSNVFGVLPPQAQAAIGAGLVGAVALTTPLIGGAISGAVVGGIGAGGIVGGVAVAATHPQVQAAAKLTGAAFKNEMQRGAVSFVPATVEALGVVRGEIGGIGDDWERASEAASTMLVPLTRDVLSGAEAAVDGFATAVERSGPAVEVLGDIARDAGELVGETFEKLSANAYEGSRALAALWGVFRAGVSSVVSTIAALTEAYGWMEKLGALLAGDRDKFVQLIVEEHNARAASGGLNEELQKLINSFGETGETAAAATVEVETLSEAIRRMAGENITAEQANIRLEEAIDRATAAGKENSAGIDANTAKGRENRQALIGIAEAANASADAILTQTGSQELASAATDRGRAKFLEVARAMNVGKDAARRLADQLFGIPASRKTEVTVNTRQAEAAVSRIKARLSEISRRIGVDVVVNARYASYGGGKGTGSGYSTGMSAGGPVTGPGPKGIDTEPRMLAVGEHVLTAREVDALGGHRAVEQMRAMVRGERPSPVAAAPTLRSAGPAGGGISEDRLARAVARALSGLTLVLDDRTGRTATLIARGA